MELGKFLTFLLFSLAVFMSVCVRGQPQRNSQRGRAISGFNRNNDADYDKKDYQDQEDNNPPRKYGRRGYRSNCRCAKISNCPKLQITIPRCPPEEFVCCFN